MPLEEYGYLVTIPETKSKLIICENKGTLLYKHITIQPGRIDASDLKYLENNMRRGILKFKMKINSKPKVLIKTEPLYSYPVVKYVIIKHFGVP